MTLKHTFYFHIEISFGGVVVQLVSSKEKRKRLQNKIYSNYLHREIKTYILLPHSDRHLEKQSSWYLRKKKRNRLQD